MNMVLNLINRISDSEAEYLYEHNKDDTEDDAKDNSSDSHVYAECRRLVLFISHSRDLIAFGFIDNNLVWFSSTKTDDLLLTRRIFDCMKVGRFYRKVTPDKALTVTGIVQRDLCGMCRVDVKNLESDCPVFTGCLTNSFEPDKKRTVTSVDFANIIAVLPQRIKTFIDNIGSTDDILIELEKDYQALEALSSDDNVTQEKRDKASAIRRKWYDADCLNMSDRATIRSLYRDICYHRYAVELPSIADMLAAK